MSQIPQSKYYYYEKNGTKQGPFTIQQIGEYIKNKFIIMETIIEFDNQKMSANDFVNQINNNSQNKKNNPNQKKQYPSEKQTFGEISETSTYDFAGNTDSTVNLHSQQVLFYIIGIDNKPTNQAYNLRQLQMLVESGKITPHTVLECPNYGHISAKQIADLKFPEAITPTGRTGPNEPYSLNEPDRPNEPYSLNEPYSIPEYDKEKFFNIQQKQSLIVWLFDFSFKNIRVLDFIAKIIKIDYVLSIFVGFFVWMGVTFVILSFSGEILNKDLPIKIILILLFWLLYPFYLIYLKLISESTLVFVRWVSATLAASEIYVNKNKNKG